MVRLEDALRGYLRELAADASAARTFLLEIYAAGPAATALRYRVLDGFIVGGIASLVTGQVAMGRHATLPKLSAPILAHVRSLLGQNHVRT